jgi:hypothetical protein
MACNNCEPCESIYSEDGCDDSISSSCVPYNGVDINCLNITSADNLNTIIKKLADAICLLAQNPDSTTCPNLGNLLPLANITSHRRVPLYLIPYQWFPYLPSGKYSGWTELQVLLLLTESFYP